MSSQEPKDIDDFALFQQAVKGVKQLRQDTITHEVKRNVKNKLQVKQTRQAKDEEFYFSDEYVPLLSQEGPMRFVSDRVSHYELKRLRRGDYVPDVFLDLHGMTQKEAKRELGAMIAYCKSNEIHCACVQHGIGKHILKQKTPLWLAQHPDILAFHQAPLEFGGAGALLVLLSIPEKEQGA